MLILLIKKIEKKQKIIQKKSFFFFYIFKTKFLLFFIKALFKIQKIFNQKKMNSNFFETRIFSFCVLVFIYFCL